MSSDVERIEEQHRRLRLSAFDEDVAWRLGNDLRRRAIDRGVAVTIEVRIAGETVFLHAMRGTAPANADWARRKRNVVELLHRSSYAVGIESECDGQSELELMGMPQRDVACHGGSFPIAVDGIGCVGVVTVSGLPQRADHELVVEALADLCEVDLADVRLDMPYEVAPV
jgi:uncharacterized protein (UPF0303 family)